MDAGDPPSYLLNQVSALFTYLSLEVAISALGIIILLLLSALVSGAEAAFFSLSEAELEICRQEPRASHTKMLQLLQNPRRLLTTLLVIDNFINIGLIMITLNAIIRIAGTNDLSFSTILVTALALTIAIGFFGEVLPKIRASQNRLHAARRMAGLVQAASFLVAPISGFLLALSNLIEKNVRNKPGSIIIDELQNAIDATISEENSPEEKEILKGVVTFGSISVKQVMRTRVDISAFSAELPFPDLLTFIKQERYSRVPVYKGTIDQIEGILYIKDLLPHLDAGPDFAWQQFLKPPYFVPESKKIDDLLREFQEMRVHMAVVVDEYGGTSGLLTFEDIIEEIVGEINDEFDEAEESGFLQLDENTYVFEGQTPLNDFCRTTGIAPDILEPHRKNSESVAGLLLEVFSRIPQEGEEIELDSCRFVIEEADIKRVKRVKVYVGHPDENSPIS